MFLLAVLASWRSAAAGPEDRFREHVRPILDAYCVGCHGAGLRKGGVALDEAATGADRLRDGAFWWSVLRNVRSGLMPPAGESPLSDEERLALEGWIKRDPLGIDPADVDPGRVAVRRLNRVEYRNTIRDLLGVDHDTAVEFPPDDSGHGFDNNGDVLTLSPMLLEKYLAAAQAVVAQVVPSAPRVVAEAEIAGRRFRRVGDDGPRGEGGPRPLSFYEPAAVSCVFVAEHAGRHELVLKLRLRQGRDLGVDRNRCRVAFRVDGREVSRQEYGWHEDLPFSYRFDLDWAAGEHELTLAVEPLTPGERPSREMVVQVEGATVRGPLDRRYWVRPEGYARIFPKDVPESAEGRRAYTRDLMRPFARRAFRRPPDEATVDRLVGLVEREASLEGGTYEAGVARAMAAVLASPMFLFREERAEEGSPDRHPLVDEYTLASRLSYFLWSSMPDDELFRLADARKLRENLPAQLGRMLADPKAAELTRNFVGQWLQVRDVESIPVHAFDVIRRDRPSDLEAARRGARWRELGRRFPDALSDGEARERDEARAAYFRSFRRFRDYQLDDDLRRAMRRETEMVFDRVFREDRSLRALLVDDSTFLNERLAKHYGVDDVRGEEMRLVALPPGSRRGGVLTQGAVLAVTSNPDRTSPVKRGLFILDNILGVPPPAQPPNIPPLEAAEKTFKGRTPTTRETLELHRKKPECVSCHARMDPLGLALENFDALGRWRDLERGNPVDPAGRLVTGEPFADVDGLKRLLADDRRRDFYRCLSEKMLTYALGRGLDRRDVEAVDRLVDRLGREGGRAGALISGVVESAPFQRRRRPGGGDVPDREGRLTTSVE